MPDFKQALTDTRLYFYDGGYGTLLQQRGLPAGLSPELWALEEPDVLRGVHREYLEAGADILTTNTFGGSAPKLGPEINVTDFNRKMAQIARSVAGDSAFVSGSVGPTGKFVEPLGPLTFRELVDIFKAQIQGLVEGGVDLIKAETHFDLAEAKAVVVATREICDLPILVSMTFEDNVSLTGSNPLTVVDTLQNLGVDIIGINCSAGPEQILQTVKIMQARLETPLHVQPNAGLPELEDGKTVFRLDPASFAEQCAAFPENGAKTMGGCCGTTPAHIKAVKEAVGHLSFKRNEPEAPACTVVTSRAQSAVLGFSTPAAIIGERINPTGKKQLTEELQNGVLDYAMTLAQEQIDLGASILDVNVGAPMVKEEELLPAMTKQLTERVPTPLCIDSNSMDAIEEALWTYPASPLVNSISGEPGRMERLGPLCKKFGAPFILLPLKGRKLPVSAEDRIAIIDELVAQADDLGIPRRLIVVDALVLTVSSKPEAAKACLEVIEYCTNTLGLATTMGLSNVSFGLPARELVNTTFLTMCMAKGATSFIANPSSDRLREAMAASEVLLNRDPQAENFIAGYADWKPGTGGSGSSGGSTKPAAKVQNLHDAVVMGAKDKIVEMIKAELEKNREPFKIVNEDLIPGIMAVGEKYERKEYFLPQLLLSAETMQIGFGYLKPLLAESGAAAQKPVIVMATVEGDIHDIGKNIVCLMLRNHGFEVIDLGKDVPAEKIIDAAQEYDAPLIGLSALMTTTMVRMEDVIKLRDERGLNSKIIIGGAVITEAFGEAIGADGVSTDAVSAVKLAKSLLPAEMQAHL